MEENHLELFNGKCSILVPESTFIRFMEGKDSIGYAPDDNNPYGSMFVSSQFDVDRALQKSNGNIAQLEETLGLRKGHFDNEPIVRVDVNNPENHGLRIANGKETGANEFYNTPLDENGKLPNIQYTRDGAGRWSVDTEKTDPKELAKLNGQYWDQIGKYHAPNTEG